jgi:hypothetical protein
VNTFGVSAPGDKAYEHFGFTASNLTARATDVIAFYTKQGTALSCCFSVVTVYWSVWGCVLCGDVTPQLM